MSDLTAIVPYRADADGARRRNATIVLNWLAGAGIRTVFAEHADEPDHALALPPATTRVVVGADGGPFSKALACNAGFAVTDSEVVALVDADTLMPMAPFLECARGVREGYDAIRPFGRLIELDEAATAAVAAGGPFPESPPGERDDRRAGEHIPLCGGLVILRSQAYTAVGGMDPAFRGWGGEDDALSVALARSGHQCGILGAAAAFHLSHPRTMESRYGHPDYAGNLARARWWHEAPIEEIEAAMRAGQERLRTAQDRPVSDR